jgi:hypothetical protein
MARALPTQIAASGTGPQSGPGGTVTVEAGTLTIEGGASSTVGPGTGGDVNITVSSDIVLPDPGPQITPQSTGGGDAGSITVSAVRLLMNDSAAISTEVLTSTAAAATLPCMCAIFSTSSAADLDLGQGRDREWRQHHDQRRSVHRVVGQYGRGDLAAGRFRHRDNQRPGRCQ